MPGRERRPPARYGDYVVDVPKRVTRAPPPAAPPSPPSPPSPTPSPSKSPSPLPAKSPSPSPSKSPTPSVSKSTTVARSGTQSPPNAMAYASSASSASPASSNNSSVLRATAHARSLSGSLQSKMSQAIPMTKQLDSFTVFDPKTGKDVGGIYYGAITSAARAAFRNNGAVDIKTVGNKKEATFWFRLRDRMRNTNILYQVYVLQKRMKSKKVKNFKKFIKNNAECDNGPVNVSPYVHSYSVEILKGPLQIDASTH